VQTWSRRTPALWVACLFVTAVLAGLAVIFAFQGEGRSAVLFGLPTVTWGINTWNLRRRSLGIVDEPARAAWDRIDDAEARLELYRRG